jgi:hypothetical protein
MGVLFRSSSKVPTRWREEDNETRSHCRHAVAGAEVRQSLDARGWLVTPDRGWKSSKAELFPADIPCLRLVRPDGGNLDFASSEKLPPGLSLASLQPSSCGLSSPAAAPHLPLASLPCHQPTRTAVSSHQPSICGKRLPLPPPRPPVGILFSQRLPHCSFALLPTCFAVDPAAAESLRHTGPGSDVTPPDVLHAACMRPFYKHPVTRLRPFSISARSVHSSREFSRKSLSRCGHSAGISSFISAVIPAV